MYLSVYFPELSELIKNDSNNNKSSGNNTVLSSGEAQWRGSGAHEGERTGKKEGERTGKKEGEERCGLELTVKNISLEVFSFKPYVINNSVLN